VADTKKRKKDNSLSLHRLITFLLYISAIALAYWLLSFPAFHTNLVTTLSSGAILATFGSALATVGSLWTNDHAGRIALNVDILFRDILKQDAWRRWPFLLRNGTTRLFGGEILEGTLKNPLLPLHVGSHIIKVAIPTVHDDFFDLPLFRNICPLFRFRRAALTKTFNATKDELIPESPLAIKDQYMAYECLTDIWWSVLVFRIARYVVHFGAALTIASTCITFVVAAAVGSAV
jgi:hypothetical protein